MRNEHANVQIRINGIMFFFGIRGKPTSQLRTDRQCFIDYRSAAGAIWTAHLGRARHHHAHRCVQQHRYGRHLRRQPGNADAEFAIRRHRRADPILLHRTLVRKQYRPGKSDGGLEHEIHDHTEQENGFGYVSTIIDPYTRLSLITGASVGKFQEIPNSPGQTPNFTAYGISDLNSSQLNENQIERNYFGVAALQRSINGADVQLSYFTRYSSVHFSPDPIGDIIFNGVASDVYRSSFSNGVTGDASYLVNSAHTLRGGFILRTEKTQVTNTNTLEPLDDMGDPVDAPFTVVDPSSLVGYTVGAYLQDEWRLTKQLTLNTGLRFDQYWQYMSEN